VAGAKSDHADAVVLAGILRTDAATHRPLPVDSELVQAIAVLARAQQDAVWSRQQLAMKLRWLLREFFPAALAAFHPKARRPDRPRGPRRAGRRANPPRRPV
jgi:transposase